MPRDKRLEGSGEKDLARERQTFPMHKGQRGGGRGQDTVLHPAATLFTQLNDRTTRDNEEREMILAAVLILKDQL